MGLDMTNFKVIYKEQVFNCLSMIPTVEIVSPNTAKVNSIEVMFLNSQNRVEIIRDEAIKFQFVSK